MVYSAALRIQDASIILGHSHPPYNLKFSNAGQGITKKNWTGKIMELPIQEHLILSPDGGILVLWMGVNHFVFK